MSPRSVRGRNDVAGFGRNTAYPIALSPAAYKGAWVYTEAGGMAYSNGQTWVSSIGIIASVITVTVGVGGNYATLGQALAYMSTFSPTASNFESLGIIRILSGTTLSEQVQMFNANLGWVTIKSDDEFVPVSINGLTQVNPFTAVHRSFMLFANSVAPMIATKFTAIGTNSYLTIGLDLRSSNFIALAPSALINANVTPSTSYNFAAGIFGFTQNIRSGTGSSCRINGFELGQGALGNTQVNMFNYNSVVSIVYCRLRGATIYSTLTGFGGSTSVNASDVQKVQGTNSSSDIYIENGGMVQCTATALGGINTAHIVPSGSGIIFDARISSPPNWIGFISPQPYTVATAPSATAYPGSMIYVSNGASGSPTIAFSNGTSWLRLTSGAAISL